MPNVNEDVLLRIAREFNFEKEFKRNHFKCCSKNLFNLYNLYFTTGNSMYYRVFSIEDREEYFVASQQVYDAIDGISYDERIFNKEGKKLLEIRSGESELLATQDPLFDKTGFIVKYKTKWGVVYKHYKVEDGKLIPIMDFDNMKTKIENSTMIITNNGEDFKYHCKEGIVDSYDFFDEYHESFAGVNYSEQGKHVGIGTVTEGDNTHTIIGIVNCDGVLVSPLLDWNSQGEYMVEYGEEYMDPTMFEDAIDEIRSAIIEENREKTDERCRITQKRIKEIKRRKRKLDDKK